MGVGLKLTYFAAVASSYFALTSNNSDCTFSKARKEKRKSIKHLKEIYFNFNVDKDFPVKS